MSEFIINSKLATAGPRHFELQKYPPKENYMKKIAVSTEIRAWDHKTFNFQSNALPLDQADKT